ncbi:MAG: carbohydrate ABC transporter permease [Propionibacteriaceae bacterium]|nr:carbohydrate ABC transporter permease [Propionibacteriaceae bacterium]
MLSVLLALVAAYALSRHRFAGKGLFSFLFFSSQMLPEALIVVPLYATFVSLRLLDQHGGLALANTAFAMPVAVWILKAAIDGIPLEIEEAARLDGCRSAQILRFVILPVIAPSLAAAAVIAFFDAWNEYLFATTFIRTKDNWLASTGLASFQGEYQTPLDLVFSGAFIFALPAIIFFLLVQKRIVSGLTAGSVKG